MELVRERRSIPARVAWLGIEQQFLGNCETRALHLDAEFRNFTQGDLYIDDYCRKMKVMADALQDFGEPVPDRTLVLNVLRGLNSQFQFMAHLIPRQKPFPPFWDVRSDLRLAELNMPQSSPAPTALVAIPPTTTSRPPTLGPTNGARPPANGGSGTLPGGQAAAGGSNNGSSGNGGCRRRRGSRNGSGPGWPSVYDPWTGTISMWPGTAGRRPRAPRPGDPQQLAFVVGAP